MTTEIVTTPDEIEANITYGYGFALPEPFIDNVRDFLTRHSESFSDDLTDLELLRKIISGDVSDTCKNDLNAFYDKNNYVYKPIHSNDIMDDKLIMVSCAAYIMTKETRIRFIACTGNVEGGTAILFPMRYPWEYTSKEKVLHFSSLERILMRYIEDMNLKTSVSDVKYIFVG